MKVREWRELRALSMGELAELADLSVQTVYRAEHGWPVTPKTVRAVARALRTTPEELREAPDPARVVMIDQLRERLEKLKPA